MASCIEDALVKKKREHIREVEKLGREASKAERECRLQVYHRKEVLEAIDVEAKQMASEREAELKKVRQQLATTKINVKKFRDFVQSKKQRPASHAILLDDLKLKMVEIETSITSFKSKQKTVYDDLIRNESQCVNEIASLEKKMASWEQQQQQPHFQHPSSSARGGNATARVISHLASTPTSGQEMPPAVGSFERFQRQSGVLNGWNEEDHAIFLRSRQKHKGKIPAFLDELLPLLVPRRFEDLDAHEHWFREYSRLLEAKKTAIDEWREGKMSKRKEESDSYAKTEDSEKENVKKKEMEKREKDSREKLKREADLAAWKVAKELSKIQEEEDRLRQELEQRKQEENDQIRKAEVKAIAEAFAREKKEAKRAAKKEEEKRERKEREARRKTAAEEILKFQERDQMSVAQRLVFNKMQAEQLVDKEKRLEKMKENVVVNVGRDPTRLVKPTKLMEERQRAKEEEEKTKVDGVRNRANFNVKQIPHRATPSWRAGV